MALFGKKSDKTKQTETQVAEVKDVKVENASLNLPEVLLQPRISEKAGVLAKLNKYVFIVKARANKIEVKKAVESQYKVRVLQVNMINTQGKAKTFGKTLGVTKGFKKAIVALKQGDSIKGLTDVV